MRGDIRELLQGNYRIVYLVQKMSIVVLTVFEGDSILSEKKIDHQ